MSTGSGRHELTRPWQKALRPIEVWIGLASSTTTSVTVALRHLRLNACSPVSGDEQQFGVVGLCWRCGRKGEDQVVGHEICVKKDRCG